MKKDIRKAGIILGVGLGGFVDGIVLHQLLQAHSMLSAKLPQDVLVNVKVSMIWDGFFHLFTWIYTTWGIVLLFRAVKKHRETPGRMVVGYCLFGWGLFNVVEGLLDHVVFNLHHVIEAYGQSWADYAFLAFGLLLCIAGWKYASMGAKTGVVKLV
ncbi:MAG: DUF2243 domain-containing protein [Chitinophagaceae bacterium]|nr:MAG: DUF2243 domain-containing protein [Chitinophagaceae bacterium]